MPDFKDTIQLIDEIRDFIEVFKYAANRHKNELTLPLKNLYTEQYRSFFKKIEPAYNNYDQSINTDNYDHKNFKDSQNKAYKFRNQLLEKNDILYKKLRKIGIVAPIKPLTIIDFDLQGRGSDCLDSYREADKELANRYKNGNTFQKQFIPKKKRYCNPITFDALCNAFPEVSKKYPEDKIPNSTMRNFISSKLNQKEKYIINPASNLYQYKISKEKMIVSIFTAKRTVNRGKKKTK